MKSFATSQFGCYPLIWIFHSRRLNNIKTLFMRAISTFQELLNRDSSVSLHHRNLQFLATERFKIHRGFSPDILTKIFVPKISSYNLCRNIFERRKVQSVYHGTELLSCLGPKIWDLFSLELKPLESLEVFKFKIKKSIPFECPYRFCWTYIQQVGIL